MKNEAFYNFNMWFLVIGLLFLIAISLMYIAFFKDSERPQSKHRHSAE